MLIVRSSRMLDVRLFSKSHPDIIDSVGVVNRRLYYDDVILDDTRTYVRVESFWEAVLQNRSKYSTDSEKRGNGGGGGRSVLI